MSAIAWTPQQRRAIETIDRSVLVSAAAGSGKTAVLAERCAHLVCDAPPPRRCSVDGLLVVTFTEAAAAEMRSRIRLALESRLAQKPHDGHLRSQLALLGTAQISTIHAFCLWMLRRWFNEVSIDPAAVILDQDEARLLKSETIDGLFRGLYESDVPQARHFRDLVDAYALGQDQAIAAHVLSLYEFITSLPPTDDWTERMRRRVLDGEPIIADAFQNLSRELQRQAAHCRTICETISASLPEGAALYVQPLTAHADCLEAWHALLRTASAARFERVRAALAGYELKAERAPVYKDLQAKARREHAKALFDQVGELFERRVQRYFGRFTPDEMRAGLRQVAPYVESLLELVSAFQQRYQAAKRALDALDFSDLERLAFELLHGSNGVAAELRDRFAHVLVDEFQDVNPLQQAILQAASRESDPHRPANLFAVGDVKQSIYRFRLAEPTIFLNRMAAFEQDTSGGLSTPLQENFRSRKTILDGINLIFRSLMRRSAGLIEYDASAELRCGDAARQTLVSTPIEVHLLERKLDSGGEAEDEDQVAERSSTADDPASWESVEREACLIGTRIRALLAGGTLANGAPLRYRDIAILLRSAAHRAGPMASMLGRMGIPAYTSAGQTLFETIEIQDVLALLRVLDNAQQDIPLAAVLGSGITGMSLTPDDLVTLRCFDPAAPFHEAVREFARRGPGGDLKDRLTEILDRVERYRRRIRRRPLADVLWAIYSATAYLAHATGLENGLQRRANLLYLHERARQFGTFAKQGLHRFLRFIESLQRAGQEIGAAPALGEAEDVVRILTIHQSKGLEYPVAFVADLGKKFNLEDASGRIIFDRDAGIGLRVVDSDRMIEYPSIAHHAVAQQIACSARDEELRVLYVALTRARERLILVGSCHLDPLLKRCALQVGQNATASRAALTDLDILTANAPLDWIVPALAAAPCGMVHWQPAKHAESDALFHIHTHTSDEMSSWKLRPAASESLKSLRRAIARLEALPANEPLAADTPEIDEVCARLKYEYPFLPAASIPAIIAASQAQRTYDFTVDDLATPTNARQRAAANRKSEIGNRKSAAAQEDARLRGIATHRLLQHLDLAHVATTAAIRAQVEDLIRQRRLSPEEAAVVDIDSIAWFFATPLGKRLRLAGASYQREFMFLSSEPACLLDPTLGSSIDDELLVRGVIDGILVHDSSLEIIDFKTDAVEHDQLAERAADYRLQMQLYARAAARHWRRPVAKCHLAFVSARDVIELPGFELEA
ncbi:MAG TPA: helicase-exonuclease AddAB subunit AddA [Phycisphaerae bacterium]